MRTQNAALTDVTAEELARFWSHVERSEGGCWPWVGSTTRGYGYFFFRARPAIQVHRFIYRATVGAIPEGHQIDHLCRVRNCVNPQHLEAVTQQVNLRRSSQTILTAEDVRRIYALTDDGCGRKEIALLFGVHPVVVSRIALGYAWRDLYDEWQGPNKGALLRKRAA